MAAPPEVSDTSGSSSDWRWAGAAAPCTGQKRARPRAWRLWSGSDVGSIGQDSRFSYGTIRAGGDRAVGGRGTRAGGARRRYRHPPPGHTPPVRVSDRIVGYRYAQVDGRRRCGTI
nr:hypothetical protein GCM10020092_085270 [Actinoplanes digitatis]